MKFFRYKHKAKSVTIFPLVCCHIGAAQADEEFIEQHVQRIAERDDARWVYLGDGGECVVHGSKGNLYEQLLTPDEQIDRLIELLEPIRGKGLFGISGNHDRRISKLSGIDWTHQLCARLGIPYMGLSCFMHLTLDIGHRSIFDLFWHHGTDSSTLLQGKIRSAKKLEQLVWADAIFSAHSHICSDLPPTYTAYLAYSGVKYRELRNFVCGCAYDSRVPGYAEEKAYSPILPAYLGVTFETKKVGGRKDQHWVNRMECEIWRKQL